MCQLPCKISRDMEYRSDSIAISRDICKASFFSAVHRQGHAERGPISVLLSHCCKSLFLSFKGRSKEHGKTPTIGCTPKGSYSPRGRPGHLLETPFSEPLLRILPRTIFTIKPIASPLLRGATLNTAGNIRHSQRGSLLRGGYNKWLARTFGGSHSCGAPPLDFRSTGPTPLPPFTSAYPGPQ